MAAEQKRHCDLKLCMFCGDDSHFTDKCEKKAEKNKAKAHAAKATNSPQEQLGSTSGSTPEAKKNGYSTPGANLSGSSTPNPTPSPVPSDPTSDMLGHTLLKAPHISLINAAAFLCA
ncbi:hypothetical protein ID866_9643, partial [Astraeus odoratus]